MFPKELENNEQEKNNARVRVKGSFDKFPIKAVQSPAQEAWKAICCADEHDANNELPIKLKDGSLTQCKVWQYRASNRKAIECEFLTTRAALVATITRKNIKPVTQEKHR
jgi:hypothetical protein